ncbi:MAG: hypothetical protein ACYTFT_14415, partial [Planctomycetota bacterium]
MSATLPRAPWRNSPVSASDVFLHAARRVRWRGLRASGLSWREVAFGLSLAWRLRLTIALMTRTLRYRVRVVRWLRADVGAFDAAPLRGLVDHGARCVYFDYDRLQGASRLDTHPAVLDEAGHIIERLAQERSKGASRRDR